MFCININTPGRLFGESKNCVFRLKQNQNSNPGFFGDLEYVDYFNKNRFNKMFIIKDSEDNKYLLKLSYQNQNLSDFGYIEDYKTIKKNIKEGLYLQHFLSENSEEGGYNCRRDKSKTNICKVFSFGTYETLNYPLFQSIIEGREGLSTQGIYGIIEYPTEGLLIDNIYENRNFKNLQYINRVIKEICIAVQCVHENHYVHLDLTPENLTLTRVWLPFFDTYIQTYTIKILDFSSSKKIENQNIQNNGIIGTPGYIAPEMISGGPCDYKCDVWSIGMITLVCLLRYFDIEPNIDDLVHLETNKLNYLIVDNISRFRHTDKRLQINDSDNSRRGEKYKYYTELEKKLNTLPFNTKRFILKCLKVNTEERFTIQQCLQELETKSWSLPSSSKGSRKNSKKKSNKKNIKKSQKKYN